jgi:hypothetical protein
LENPILTFNLLNHLTFCEMVNLFNLKVIPYINYVDKSARSFTVNASPSIERIHSEMVPNSGGFPPVFSSSSSRDS